MRTVSVFAAALLALSMPACGPRVEPPASPYGDSDGALPQGFLAAVRVDLARSSFARALELDLGDDAVLHFFFLDDDLTSGGEAMVLSGPGAAELEDVLRQQGWLSTEADGEAHRLGGDSLAAAAPMHRGAAGMALGLLRSRPLRRFEVDGRIVFAPTIDVRRDLVDLDAAATAQLQDAPELAIALDGRRLARALGDRLEEAIGPIGTMAAQEVERRHPGRGGADSGNPLQGMLAALRSVRALRATYGEDGARARVRFDGRGPFGELVAALRPLVGEWPLVDEGGLKFGFACDPGRAAEALKRLAGLFGAGAQALAPPPGWDGRIAGTFALDAMEASRAALGTSVDSPLDGAAVTAVFPGLAKLLASARPERGWLRAPAPGTRWGSFAGDEEVFLLVRDGKTPVEEARVVLRGKRTGESTIELEWLGLLP